MVPQPMAIDTWQHCRWDDEEQPLVQQQLRILLNLGARLYTLKGKIHRVDPKFAS